MERCKPILKWAGGKSQLLIYGQAKKQNGFKQEELGKMDDITPFGRVFINADTIQAFFNARDEGL